jgi:hypothetical protein
MRLASAILILLVLPACQSLKRPSSDPAKMSSDTLCYRAANKNNEALQNEIDRRNLNCNNILQSDPLYNRDWR